MSRPLRPLSKSVSNRIRAASSGAASSDARTATASCRTSLGRFNAVLARGMTVGKGGQESHVGQDRRPHIAFAGATAASWAGSPIENILEAADILARDQITSRRRAHRLEQRHRGCSRTSCASADPNPPGEASTIASNTDAASSIVIAASTSPTFCRRSPLSASAAFASGAQSRRMPRLVLVPTACACRPHGLENAPADRQCRVGQRAGGDLRAFQKLIGRHAVAIGEEVDVAWFQRLDFEAAGGLVGRGDRLARQSHLRNWPVR